MNKLIKNKKGSSVLETIILFPFLLYLILFSAFKVMSYFAFSSAYQEATFYVRNVIVCQSSRDMFDRLASIVYNPSVERKTNSNTSITSISVTKKNGTKADKITANFDNFGEGQSTFASFCKIDEGKYVFNYDYWFDPVKTKIENEWENGSIIEIKLSRDLTTDIMKSAVSLQIFDFQTGKRISISLGIDTDVKVYASNVISI